MFVTGRRTRRSALTASERSTARGITTGMIGTTGRRGGKQYSSDELRWQDARREHSQPPSHPLSPLPSPTLLQTL